MGRGPGEELRTGYPGVRLELGIDPGPYLVLFSILLPQSERGNGLGTRVMEHITPPPTYAVYR
ncbi:hypothetical protein ACFYNW_34675 [Streptomyces virginiae]|uniref:hypothetical protein n=1 Tax=Streptomyces virginiae TaxID=1961 RepID=UPI0036ED1383